MRQAVAQALLVIADPHDQTVDSKAAQAQLGHANEDITLEHYIHKAKVAPDLTDYLERFRPPITPKT